MTKMFQWSMFKLKMYEMDLGTFIDCCTKTLLKRKKEGKK